MKRPQFSVLGTHPLLYLVRDHLIQRGFALVPSTESVDFYIIGAELFRGKNVPFVALESILSEVKDTPVLLLSSSGIYCDRTAVALEVTKPDKMSESHGTVIPSPVEKGANRALYSLLAEHSFIQRGQTMIIRPFNVYGPNIRQGVVHDFVYRLKRNKPLVIYNTGKQVRSFLYEEDFLHAIEMFVEKTFKGARGIYNLGNKDEVYSLELVAKTACEMFKGGYDKSQDVVYQKAPFAYNHWKVPDMSKTIKFLSWKPSTSLRKGLWYMNGDSYVDNDS